jgi:tRNA nucleotidyltransferase (CCA-adding enzyme)
VKTNLADIGAIASKALPLCEPTPSEHKKISMAAEKCRELVRRQVEGNDAIVEVLFGGSYAKGTWLRGDADVDVFVKVKPDVDMEAFEEMGKDIGLQALRRFRPKLRYSDHPYVEASVDGTTVNVVPCYDVEPGKWQSAADRSPFHTEYIMKNFGSEEKSQTRLLKSFLKSAGIYGAEISVGGFSGYVSEVLVMKYKRFESVLAAGAQLQEGQVISVTDTYDRDVVKGFSSPLVIIDPIDDRRNLGTAISPESVGKFVLASRAFLSRPSLRFFGKRQKSNQTDKGIHSNILVVEFRHKEKSPDIIWGQLKRSMAAVKKQLEIADFEVIRASCVSDEKSSAAMAFLLESLILPRYTRKKGPEVFRAKDSDSFLSHPKNNPHIVWVDAEMRAMMLVDRKETDAVSFVKSLFERKIENSGISKELLASRSMLKIYSGKGKKMSGLAKEAVDEIVSTEHFIFK